MKFHKRAIFVALCCAILLAFISSLIGAAIGPGLRILGASTEESFSLKELLGPNLSLIAKSLFGIEHVSGHVLLGYLPFFLLALALAKAVFYFTQNYIWENVSEIITKGQRNDLIKRYLESKIFGFRESDIKDKSADISSVLTTDIRLIREYLVHFYGGLPREMLQVVFLSITLFLLSGRLFSVFLFALLPAGYITRSLGKKFKRRTESALNDYSFLTEWLQQRFLGIETIKHLRTEELEIAKMNGLNDVLFKKLYRAAKTKALAPPMVEFIAIAALVGVFAYALYLIYNQELTSSVALSFFASLAMLSQSCSELSRYLLSNRQGAAAKKRLSNVESALIFDPDNDYFSYKDMQNVALRLQSVSFGYPAKRKLFDGYSFDFHKACLYCLKGPSGVGKSTLVKLVLGLLKCESGSILVSQEFARSQPFLVYVPQTIVSMNKSIALNIAYPHEEFDPIRMNEALLRVGLWEFVQSLPLREQTKVGTRGRSLSGGQSQRLHLARLCYHKPPLAVVDEGTSNLDVEVESLISALLLDLRAQGMCIIAISHRPALFHLADQIIDLGHQ